MLCFQDVYSGIMERSSGSPRLLSVEEKWQIIFNEVCTSDISGMLHVNTKYLFLNLKCQLRFPQEYLFGNLSAIHWPPQSFKYYRNFVSDTILLVS